MKGTFCQSQRVMTLFPPQLVSNLLAQDNAVGNMRRSQTTPLTAMMPYALFILAFPVRLLIG